MKFKVGDEVRVIEEASGVLFGDTVGNVCKIKKVNNEDGLTYELDNGFLYREDCLEPITDHDYLMDKILERNNKPELVNHPDHYQGNKFEVIDIIEDYELNFTLGSAVKYILRAGKKDDKNIDLKKAIWMLEREIENENN